MNGREITKDQVDHHGRLMMDVFDCSDCNEAADWFIQWVDGEPYWHTYCFKCLPDWLKLEEALKNL